MRTVVKLGVLACVVAVARPAPVAAAPADRIPASAAWVRISVAELRARYDVLWAMSDVHGRRKELQRVLVASGLATDDGSTVAWNPVSRRHLVVIAGDLIDGGPDSVGVVLLLDRLQRQAAAAGSRIVVLLGNHEAAFLADPRSATRELLASAHRHRADLGMSDPITVEGLDASAFGAYLRGLPVAAFVGTWLFAHAGWIDAAKDERALDAYFTQLGDTVGRRDRRAFAALLDPRSIVAFDHWSRSDRLVAKMRPRLELLGLNGLLVGHDPDALRVRGTMAVNREGWLLKLDTGLKLDRSSAALLRCNVADVLSSNELVMARGGAPTCGTVTARGPGPLPVAH